MCRSVDEADGWNMHANGIQMRRTIDLDNVKKKRGEKTAVCKKVTIEGTVCKKRSSLKGNNEKKKSKRSACVTPRLKDQDAKQHLSETKPRNTGKCTVALRRRAKMRKSGR